MNKHTPGPWYLSGRIEMVGDPYSKLGQHALYCARVTHPGFIGDICTVQSADHVDEGVTRETAEANARLIAAAPELLEALQSLLWYAGQLEQVKMQHATEMEQMKQAAETERAKYKTDVDAQVRLQIARHRSRLG